jgi:N-acetylneuraminic acid mutarotase
MKHAALASLFMFAGCVGHEEYIQWDNHLVLPPSAGMGRNIGVAGPFAGIVGERLLVAGGANFPNGTPWEGGIKAWYSTLWILDTLSQKWSVYENFLPSPRGYGYSAQLNGGVLFIGGCDSDKCFSDCIYVTDRNGDIVVTTDTFPSLPFPLANCAGAVIGSKIYIAGGNETPSGASTGHFLVLDTDDPTAGWQELSSWPGPTRGYAVCVAEGGRIYLFSGRSYGPDAETVMYTDGFRYNPVSVTWEALEGSFPFMAGNATTVGNNILFLGGVSEILPTAPDHPGFSNDVYNYDTVTGKLELLERSPFPIAVTAPLVGSGKTFLIASGEIRPGVRTPNILRVRFK